MLVLSATHGAIPFLVKRFIDQLTVTKNITALRFIAIEILVVFLLRAIANFAEDYLSAFIGQKVVLDLRSDLNNHLQRLSLSFFNRTATGVMMFCS